MAEALVALLLGFFLIQLGLGSLVRLEAARRRIAVRTDALVALRIATHVLRRELRHGVGGVDWQIGSDSLGIRAFRGTAIVCATDSASATVLVSFAGDRGPDPTKDSVLFVGAEGRTEPRALLRTMAPTAPCAWRESAVSESWQLDAAAPSQAVLARTFERGSYHLSSSALRYRRGAAGRQPLTPEAWSDATGWFASDGWLGVELFPRDTRAGAPWRGVLARSPTP